MLEDGGQVSGGATLPFGGQAVGGLADGLLSPAEFARMVIIWANDCSEPAIFSAKATLASLADERYCVYKVMGLILFLLVQVDFGTGCSAALLLTVTDSLKSSDLIAIRPVRIFIVLAG